MIKDTVHSGHLNAGDQTQQIYMQPKLVLVLYTGEQQSEVPEASGEMNAGPLLVTVIYSEHIASASQL